MKPILKIRCYSVWIRFMKKLLDEPLQEEEWKEFMERLRKFKKLVREYGDPLLSSISEYVGLNWKEKDIDAYPLHAKCKSVRGMSHPLLVKMTNNPYLNLLTLSAGSPHPRGWG